MIDIRYNGYTNRETWLVGHWGHVEAMTMIAIEEKIKVDAEWCRNIFERDVAEIVPRHLGAVSELYLCALNRIDWDDIASYVNQCADVCS